MKKYFHIAIAILLGIADFIIINYPFTNKNIFSFFGGTVGAVIIIGIIAQILFKRVKKLHNNPWVALSISLALYFIAYWFFNYAS